jgi:hypothetical protein
VINITGILEEIPASNFKTEVSKERKCLETGDHSGPWEKKKRLVCAVLLLKNGEQGI